MNIGTKSLLYGIHQPLIHGFFVFQAWWKLYGFPWNPKLWVCFLLHDIGYLGCTDMDGKQGKCHPFLGAELTSFLCDPYDDWKKGGEWYHFCLYHSRTQAEKDDKTPSRLCVADKAAAILMPEWLYLFLGRLTGELPYYMDKPQPEQKWLTKFRRDTFWWIIANKEKTC